MKKIPEQFSLLSISLFYLRVLLCAKLGWQRAIYWLEKNHELPELLMRVISLRAHNTMLHLYRFILGLR